MSTSFEERYALGLKAAAGGCSSSFRRKRSSMPKAAHQVPKGCSSSDPSSLLATPWQGAIIERSAPQTAFKEKMWITNYAFF